MSQPLTQKQKEIFNFIENFIDRHDYAPSYREIARAFTLSSVATVAGHLDALKNKGYLSNQPNMARSLKIAPQQGEGAVANAPLLGIISAGEPIEAIRTNETIDIPHDMAGENVFALKVRGESMVEDGIFDGDYVIIEKTSTPQNGDIVVSLLDNDLATLKRFYREKNRIRLQPANKNYNPIYTDNVAIQGKVRGVIRKFA